MKPVPDFLRCHVHHGRPTTRRPPRAGAGRLQILGRRSRARGLLRVRHGSRLPCALARWRPDHQVRPCSRLASSRLHGRRIRPAALVRPSRRWRCRLPLPNDDVVLLPLHPWQIATGFLRRGLRDLGRHGAQGGDKQGPGRCGRSLSLSLGRRVGLCLRRLLRLLLRRLGGSRPQLFRLPRLPRCSVAA